jgi:uncharacterized protein
MKLTMKLLEEKYGVCRLEKDEPIPAWCQKGEFYSITKTSEELSIVCSQRYIPEDIKCERDWRILKVEGPLDFSLIGILASISTLLAKSNISIFALSTYDTDYILIKGKDINNAITALRSEGYEVKND